MKTRQELLERRREWVEQIDEGRDRMYAEDIGEGCTPEKANANFDKLRAHAVEALEELEADESSS